MRGTQRSAKVYSLNYDFVPTIAYADRCFWADLKWPAPESLQVGTVIKFTSETPDLVMPRGKFHVTDIIGSRIVITATVPMDSTNLIKYFRQKLDRKTWSPLDHGPAQGWGNATRNMADPNPTADRNWTYGTGDPVLTVSW